MDMSSEGVKDSYNMLIDLAFDFLNFAKDDLDDAREQLTKARLRRALFFLEQARRC